MESATDAPHILIHKVEHRRGCWRVGVMGPDAGRANYFVFGARGLQLGDEVALIPQKSSWHVERIRTHAPRVAQRPLALHILLSAIELLALTLPEGHPYPVVYEQVLVILRDLETPEIHLLAQQYLSFEQVLLSELGYGLILDQCAVSGVRDCLAYVSPKTGHAVCAAVGAPYAAQLLSYPQTLSDHLSLTGYFVAKFLLNQGELPFLRQRLMTYLAQDTSAAA